MPTDCDGSTPSGWRLSGTFARSSSEIEFGDRRVPFAFTTATAAVSRFATPRAGWVVSASGILDGEIDERDLVGGAGLGAALTYLPLYETERRPFVAFSGNASFAFARAGADDGETRTWLGGDLRAGVMAGKSFFEGKLVLHLAARAFGGPVRWRLEGERVTGGDRYHVTFGGGLSLHVNQRLSLAVEAMPLGEQSYAAGISWNL